MLLQGYSLNFTVWLYHAELRPNCTDYQSGGNQWKLSTQAVTNFIKKQLERYLKTEVHTTELTFRTASRIKYFLTQSHVPPSCPLPFKLATIVLIPMQGHQSNGMQGLIIERGLMFGKNFKTRSCPEFLLPHTNAFTSLQLSYFFLVE